MTRDERAIKIAEFEGYESKTDMTENRYGESSYDTIYVKDKSVLSEYDIKLKFSSFNGLMPIVERVNKEHDLLIFIIDEGYVTITNECDKQKFCSYEQPNETLIDALQEAIIYFYVYKGKQ